MKDTKTERPLEQDDKDQDEEKKKEEEENEGVNEVDQFSLELDHACIAD